MLILLRVGVICCTGLQVRLHANFTLCLRHLLYCVAGLEKNCVSGARENVSGTQDNVSGTIDDVSGARNIAPGPRNIVPGPRNIV